MPTLEDLGVTLTQMEDQVPWELKPFRAYQYYMDKIGEFPTPENPRVQAQTSIFKIILICGNQKSKNEKKEIKEQNHASANLTISTNQIRLKSLFADIEIDRSV